MLGRSIYSCRSTSDLFRTKALAHSFRAELVQAANAGEPFDPATGRPVSEARTKNPTTWYAHSRAYVEMKWPRAAAKTRRSIVEALTSITVTLTRPAKRGRPTDTLLRDALYLYGPNPRRWSEEIPPDHAAPARRRWPKLRLPRRSSAGPTTCGTRWPRSG
ncbi:hypothetical protein Misp05_52840 [Micromonospora sp. NBRC 107095]|nr:hypothetical protein Misp05_52840 [Micromonospora sp. NBRC 107095]